jgi:hypothetical protein
MANRSVGWARVALAMAALCLSACDSKGDASASSAPAKAEPKATSSSASSAPSGASSASTAATASAAATATASADAPSADPRFVSSEGRYSAVFPPGKTIDETREDPKKRAWTVTKSEGLMREVQFRDFASPAEANAYISEFVTGMKADIEENREVTSGSHKGRHLRLMVNSSKNLRLFLRMFVVGNRLYKVGAGTKTDEASVTEFLDSFAIEGGAAEPAASASASAAAPPGGVASPPVGVAPKGPAKPLPKAPHPAEVPPRPAPKPPKPPEDAY